MAKSITMRAFVTLLLAELSGSYFESVAASIVGGREDVAVMKSQPFSPQVVFQCGYRNRYISRDGKEWVTDKDPAASCLTGKFDILKYCKKVYPDLQITNIVESTHYYEVSNWCKLEGQPCKWSFWVKPFRCIVGQFESEALLVPENCHFGHVDDRKACKDFDYWNQTAHSECSKRSMTPTVKSFAMLEPCGLDMFSGVEFVCCPRLLGTEQLTTMSSNEPSIDLKIRVKLDDKTQTKQPAADNGDDYIDDEEYYDDDDEDDDDDDDDDDNAQSVSTPKSTKRTRIPSTRRTTVASTSQQSSTAKAIVKTTTAKDSDESDDDDDSYDSDEDDDDDTNANNGDEQDPYFRFADPDREHDMYRGALDRLDRRHREKVAKLMKEWSDLETRYQEMKEKDTKRAERFRAEMTSRFQKTVAALEEENRDERRQIEEVHQQRVNAGLNERKRETIKAFRDALSTPNARAHKVLRTLQAYIRSEEKDRVHALNRYRHLLRTDAEEAANAKPELIKKLRELDLRINGTIEMLRDVPELEEKVKPAALTFWQTFRQENTPEIIDESITWVGDEKNHDRLLETYKQQYQNEIKDDKKESQINEALPSTSDVEYKSPRTTLMTDDMDNESDVIEKPTVVKLKPAGDDQPVFKKIAMTPDGFVEHEETKQAQAYSMKDSLLHDSLIKEEVVPRTQTVAGHYGYAIFAVTGVSLLVAMVVGIAMVRRRFSARGQGFVEVDACTPEERHVAAMQVNGYENPTYKYFDEKA